MIKVKTLKRRLSGVLIIGALVVATMNGQTPQPASKPMPTGPQQQTNTPPVLPNTQELNQPALSGTGQTTNASQRAQLSSAQFISPTGLTVDRLLETGFTRRADLLAARQRLAIAEGRLIQAGLRPNPTLDSEYGSARFLGGSAENTLDVGVTQVFETAGKRLKRVEVARKERDQVRAEVLAFERQTAADMRAAYARALAAGRQLDALENLIAASNELVRITNERLKQGDVAPLELNLVKVETDRLRTQVINTRADLETELISLRTLAGLEQTEPLIIAPLPERPPRLDLAVNELTDMALRERADLRAAQLGVEAARARINLARSLATPNVAGSVRYSREKRITDLPEVLGVGPVAQTDNVLRFGVSVDIPIFNRNQGEIAAATGERLQVERQRDFLEATVRRDVALAYKRYRAAAETLVIYATQIIPNAEQNLRMVRAAYTLGEFSIFDVLSEQKRLIESETGYNEALASYYGALAELERALGTMIPASAFASIPVSVLPDVSTSKQNLVRSIQRLSNLQLPASESPERDSDLTIFDKAGFLKTNKPEAARPAAVQPNQPK
jgi:cobalt-zinc-cadmium efflux system outer membrane protein